MGMGGRVGVGIGGGGKTLSTPAGGLPIRWKCGKFHRDFSDEIGPIVWRRTLPIMWVVAYRIVYRSHSAVRLVQSDK